MAGKQLLVSFDHGNTAVWFDRTDAPKALAAGTARALTAAEHKALNKGTDRDMAFPDAPKAAKGK